MTTEGLYAGVAVRDITPQLDGRPVFLAGYGRDRRATAVESPLLVRALALCAGSQVAVIVACDLIGLDRSDVLLIGDELTAHGVDRDAVIVACTHTHSGPDTLGLWGPDAAVSGVDEAYLAHVRRAVVEAAVEALALRCPVVVRSGMGRLAGWVANYRDPAIVDDDVAAVQFIKPDGATLATLINLACHPEVFDGTSLVLSPDLAGVACRTIEARIGGMALHVSGALGGMLSPRTPDRSHDSMVAMGQAYAAAALAALADTVAAPAALRRRRSTFRVPMSNPLLRQAHAFGVLRPRRLFDADVETTCSAIDLGTIQLLTVPGELLPALGFALKAAMPGSCRIIIGLADDEIGYILPDDDYVMPVDYNDPGSQYEESMSLGPQTGSRVVGVALALLDATIHDAPGS
jgi:hypothetical protein